MAAHQRLEGQAKILELIHFQVSTSTATMAGLVLLVFFSSQGKSGVDSLGRVTMAAT